MSTNLEYRNRERQRKRESKWKKSDKPGDRDLKRERCSCAKRRQKNVQKQLFFC